MNYYYFEKPEKLVDFDAKRHAILDASAGTGKTFTLENLVVHLLIEGISIDEILVVTFTRRATAELQKRVRAKIAEMLNPADKYRVSEIPCNKTAKNYWKIDEDVRKRLQDQLNQFDRAQIFTIHSFCQNVLTGHAFENLQLFSGELTDGDRLFEDTYYEILRTLYARDPELSRWLDAWFQEDKSKTVSNLLKELKGAVRSQYPLKPAMEEKDFEAILELLENKKVPQKHRMKTGVLHKFKDAIQAELKRKKLEEGMFSFDDMLQLVHDSLYSADTARGEALTAALRARYKYALVDEFQDTDQVQWEIFKRIFLESNHQNILCAIGDPKQAIYGFRGADVDTYFGAIAELEKAGAVKIELDKNFRSTPKMIAAYNYIFDAEKTFFTKPNKYLNPVGPGNAGDGSKRSAAIEIMRLETNEKIASGPMKLSFAEGIAMRIEALLAEDNGIKASDIYVLTRSRGESALVGKTLRRHHIAYSFYREEGLFQTDEARHIGEVLAAVCRPGDRSRRLRAYLTPFFGIPLELVDSYDNLEPGGPGEKTPHERLVGWNGLGNARRFRELFQELIESSGIIRRELVVGSGERGLTNYQHLFEILMRQTAEIPGTLDDLTGWFLRLTDETDLPELEEGSLQRLETEKDAVQVMTIHKSKGLQAEVVFVLGGFARGTGGPHTYVEPGCEGDNPRPKAMCLNHAAFAVKKASDDARKNIGEFKREEGERLMYVALTRAKTLMVLPYVVAEANKCTGDYEPVMDRLHEIVKEVNAGVADPEMFSVWECPVKESVDFQAVLAGADLADWELPELGELGGPDVFAKFERARARRIVLASYSSLSHHGGKSTPSKEDGDEDLDLEGIADHIAKTGLGDSKISGMKGGDLIHDLLEFVDFQTVIEHPRFEDWCAVSTTKELVETTCKKHGFDVEMVGEEALRMVFNALTTAVSFPGGGTLKLAKLKRYVREMRFVFPIPEASREVTEVTRGFAHGFIDISFEHDGKTYFADWKSDRLPGGDFSTDALAQRVKEKYPAQAMIYTMATLRMLGITKEKEFDEKFGGFFYFFARGMTGTDSQEGVHFEAVSWADVVKLERLLREPDWKIEWRKVLQGGFEELDKFEVSVDVQPVVESENAS